MEESKMSRENALNKAKKLFNMANAKNVANENEAEQALRKAQQLMMEYNLRDFEIHAGIVNDMAKDITGKYLVQQPRTMLEDKFITGIVSRFFSVKLVWKGGSNLYAVGTETNLDIAENVYWYLRTIFRSLWLKYYYSLPVHERTTRLKQPYYDGLKCGLCDRLEDEKIMMEMDESNSTAIVAVNNALSQRFKEMFPRLGTKKVSGYRLNHSGFGAGKRDSSQINIRKGINGAHRPAPKLGGGRMTL